MRDGCDIVRRFPLWIAVAALLLAAPPAVVDRVDGKLDGALRQRARAPRGSSQVIIRTRDGAPADALIRAVGGTPQARLPLPGGQVGRVPDVALHRLARSPDIAAINLDRPVYGTMQRAAATIGARWVQEHLGLDGSGVGIATIDSGVTSWHEDLEDRIVHFADFVNGPSAAYDDYGHGTHVAGIIAGTGHASEGARRGVAPGATLIALKALDATGGGYISSVIAAIDYAIAHRDVYNIRVINLSAAAAVQESCYDDPLTLAARRAVSAGMVVVAAAGNLGRNALGRPQYGGITAPGNAPWVLTVGASGDMGTPDRADDTVARFSSRGPSAIDFAAKPDLLAPGVGIASTAEPSSALFAAHPSSRLWGTLTAVSEPYLNLSGTSMAAPVVAGTVALMLQANPSLTPNAVKAILQFTAEAREGHDYLTQGAGFLNARGAVELARTFGAEILPDGAGDPVRWSRHIIWGNQRIAPGGLGHRANAWALDVTWGARHTPEGEPVTLEAVCDHPAADCADACDAARRDCAGLTPGSPGDGIPVDPLCDETACDAAARPVFAADAGEDARRAAAGSLAVTGGRRRAW